MEKSFKEIAADCARHHADSVKMWRRLHAFGAVVVLLASALGILLAAGMTTKGYVGSLIQHVFAFYMIYSLNKAMKWSKEAAGDFLRIREDALVSAEKFGE